MSVNDLNGKLVQIMSRVGDVLILNLLTIVCSLPVVTLGAAFTAAYDMSLRLLRHQEGYVARGFFRAFRSNFPRATALWLIFLGVLVISIGDLLVRPYLPQLHFLLTVAAVVQILLVLAIALYAFPLQARFENSISGTLRNSILLAVCRAPQTAAMVLITLVPVLIFLFVPLPDTLLSCFITLCVLLWVGGAIYLNARIVRQIFQRQFGSEKPAEDPLYEGQECTSVSLRS